MSRTRVLLADDHTLFREGLVSILSRQVDFEIVGQAADGIEAVVLAESLRPDLVLMDINMPGCDGIEATRQIKEMLPQTVVVMLTVRDEDEQLFEAIRAGAKGYLVKSINSEEMIRLLRGAMRGDAAMTPALSGRVLEAFRSGNSPPPAAQEADDLLTPREIEVLKLIARGASNQQIAVQLHLSIHTVKSHVRKILLKLQTPSRHQAAARAIEQGIIPR